ncbi:MAG TPA: cytochrome c, partial [Polyangia bacterium]|nr:cytochrome c [Polyangia bacterium]
MWLQGCKNGQPEMPATVVAPVTLGGRQVSAAQLNHGGQVYTQYCRACHGVAGDGRGPAALGLRPPPRDLRLGVYKFGAVAAGQLPGDADFLRIIRGGLHGTAMLAWDVPVAELDDLIQYMKLFA